MRNIRNHEKQKQTKNNAIRVPGREKKTQFKKYLKK